MQDQEEMTQINQFLCMITPIVTSQVRMLLESAGLQVEEEGFGLDAGFSIKFGQRQLKFYLQNLLLEIATIDRDQQPLRFDQNLRDLDYFAAKTARVVESKLNVLFHLLGQDDVEAAIENIVQDAKRYERVRIWRFDQTDTDKKARSKPSRHLKRFVRTPGLFAGSSTESSTTSTNPKKKTTTITAIQ